MEVRFILSCLLVVILSVSVQPELLPVHCSNCTCVSSNGAKLHLSMFSSPIQVVHDESLYQFPACIGVSVCSSTDVDSSLICANDTTVNDIYSEGNVLKSWLDTMTHSLVFQFFNTKQLRTVIVSCQPEQQSMDDDTMVFSVIDSTDCKHLKDFILATSLHSSSILLLGDSIEPVKTRTSSSSSSTTPSVASTSHIPSSVTTASITPSDTPTPESPDDNGSYKLLYIVIPTAAPVAFIIAFGTVFCIMYYCHQQTKKKLYIKLTPTIYSDEDDGQNSDDSD